jgi:hypothetical protein
MQIIIKKAGMVLALRLSPADLRAIRPIVITVVLALYPGSRPAVEELQYAVAVQFAIWSPLPVVPEIRAGNIKSGALR